MLLCLCMMAGMLCNFGGWVLSSAAAAEATGNVMNRIADGDTSDTYIGKLLSSEWGSRYAGRVWTDKSVFANGTDIELDNDTDGYVGGVHFDSDFGTAFSALASSQRINEYPPSPIDLVILIDMSGSMGTDIVDSNHTHDDYNDPNGERITHSRIYAVLESINNTIKEVMDMGEANRVAVVGYGATAYTLMELGHYKTETEGKYLEVKNFRSYYGNNKPKNQGSAAYMVGTVTGLTKLDESTETYGPYSRHARNDYVKSGVVTADPEDTISIGFNTDLQAGIYQGFEELYKHYNSKEDVTKTYVSAETKTKTVVQRIPVAIVMTDGASNYALKSTSGAATGGEWYNVPIYAENVTTISGAWEKYRTEKTGVGNGGDATILDILMTASYEKSKVQKKYAKLVKDSIAAKELQDDRYKGTDFRILTVSVDTPTREHERPRVYATLDPVHFFNSDLQAYNGIDPSTWEQKQDVINAYNHFEDWQKTTDSITVSFSDSENTVRNIKFNQLPAGDPTDPTAVTKNDVIDNIEYNTTFADITSEQLTATFTDMLNEIRGIAFTPLSGENAAGVADSVTYQDPLGEYMEFKHSAITVTKDKDGEGGKVTGSNATTFDMSMLLHGEMHGLVRAGVYDYQWNNDYMRKNTTKKGYPADAGTNPDEDPLEIGWYKGDALTAEYSYNKETGLPTGCATAEQAWADGWVLRLDYKTLAEFVPISGITDSMTPTEIPEQIKHTAYTCYRFADSQEERNKLRRNPIFGEVPDSLQKEWEDYFKEHGSYPVGMDKYSNFTGVYRLSDIRVWTEHTGDFIDETGAITPEAQSGYDDSLYVNLPVTAVPTQLAEITLGPNGPISYKDNLADKTQSTPFRLFYAVGLTEDLIQRDADGNQTGVNVSKISGEYITTHSDPTTNNIYFISNWYSNTPYTGYASDDEEAYRTRGDAAVSFSPNVKNRYYLFQKALPLIAHAYRVTDEAGHVAPVDRAAGEEWGANGSGNGKTTWEKGQSGSNWSGGEFVGSYTSEDTFMKALALANETEPIDGVRHITDEKGYSYPLPRDVTDAVITYLGDQLTKVDSVGDGYTKDSRSFSSDDYFFLCVEYYMPMSGTGKDIYGKPDPDTQAVCKVYRMIARKGSAFGSGLHSENIDNGDMLCWSDIKGNCTTELEYNSRSDTGDDTRGRPTLEKLTLTGDRLKEYLKDTCHLKVEPNADGQSYLDLDYAYWTGVQQDPHMKALIEQITDFPTKEQQQAEFDRLFDWSVAARTGGIRVGDMFNNMQTKGGELVDGYYKGNLTKTANNYYIPTLSEKSTAGNGLVINNYLGNNGRLEVANATLIVTKTLVAPDGFTLTEEQQNETFNYQVYVQGLTGERLAQRLKWNPFSQSWQKRVESLDILTDNSSLLVDTSGNRALFCYAAGEKPRQIVEVFVDGEAKYYYADTTGAATETPCDHPPTDFYYLYLPGSAGEQNYHLFASTYEEGTTELTGVGTTAYYPAGMDTSKLPAGDNTNQQFAEAVTGQSNEIDNRPAGSREYWTKQAELIPYDEVQTAETADNPEGGDNHWSYTEGSGSYIGLTDPFPLVTVIPDPEGTDSTVYSPYRGRTQYMTTSLYFGYTAELAKHLKTCENGGAFADCKHLENYQLSGDGLYDQIIPTVDRSDLFNGTIGNATVDDVTKNTAAYTLRSGEGLLLTGLGNRITYRFTEKMTDTQIEQGYLLKEISHVQQRGSDTVYMPGVQNIPVYKNGDGTVTWAIDKGDTTERTDITPQSEPFAHTNATIWESYATMAAGTSGNHHHQPEDDDPAQNPNCNDAKYEANLDVGRCDLLQEDGTTRHYFYYGGKLVDPHYNGEATMSRYVLNPTAHFGVDGEVIENKPATNPASGKYDYNGVYSVFGNTGYFTEQANYTNTIDPELFVLVKEMADENGRDVAVAPDKEFTFTLTFDPTDKLAMTKMDSTLHYWKGNKDYTSAIEWEDTDGNKYKMPSTAPKLDEYEPYLTDLTYRLKPIEPDENTAHTYTVKLKANETIVFYGLIAGTNFTVTETENKNYPVVPGEGSINKGYTQTGTIYRASEDPKAIDPVTSPNRAEFTNLLKTGILTVEKRIKNEDPDTEKEFGFTVTLTPTPETELKPEDLEATKYKADGTAYGATDFTINWVNTTGVLKAEVTLKHGEQLRIEGIPLDTTYTVEESQRDGYNLQHVASNPEDKPEDAEGNYLTLTRNRVEGTITTAKAQAHLLFVNERAPFLPFVGGIGIGAIMLTGVLLIGLATALIVHKKYRRRRTARIGG